MYEIHFRRWYDTVDDYALTAVADCLSDAARIRLVSGDLVVYAGTNRVVADKSWLFPWELKDENSYAQKAIRHEIETRLKVSR